MNLQREFKSAFFQTWVNEGLPDTARYEASYLHHLAAIHCPFMKSNHISAKSDALHPELLKRVYGFGHLVGQTIGILLGIPKGAAAKRAEWCAKFNLGISLFDYCCDEAKEGAFVEKLPALRAFARPTEPTERAHRVSTPLHKLLNQIASEVLQSVADEVGGLASNAAQHYLWKAMAKMYCAELHLSKLEVTTKVDLKRLKSSVRFKSSEPFRVMAVWMALGDPRTKREPARSKTAGALGGALGDCFWLVDDAMDVWLDFEAGQWNYFLIVAAEDDPSLFANPRDAMLASRMTQLWDRSRVPQETARRVVRRFSKAISVLPKTPKATEALGLIGASLARWSC